jgi:hypothetical protein
MQVRGARGVEHPQMGVGAHAFPEELLVKRGMGGRTCFQCSMSIVIIFIRKFAFTRAWVTSGTQSILGDGPFDRLTRHPHQA